MALPRPGAADLDPDCQRGVVHLQAQDLGLVFAQLVLRPMELPLVLVDLLFERLGAPTCSSDAMCMRTFVGEEADRQGSFLHRVGGEGRGVVPVALQYR